MSRSDGGKGIRRSEGGGYSLSQFCGVLGKAHKRSGSFLRQNVTRYSHFAGSGAAVCSVWWFAWRRTVAEED
jgi:hypothetical protein